MYTQINQVFVGTYSATDLAYYIRSKIVINIGLNIVSSIATVLIPRTSYLIENNYNEYSNIVNKSINYIYFINTKLCGDIYTIKINHVITWW